MPEPEFAQGVSLRPILEDPAAPGHAAYAYFRSGTTVRTETHRLIVHKKDGYVELYDHTSEAGETVNVAEANPELVEALKAQLAARLPQGD